MQFPVPTIFETDAVNWTKFRIVARESPSPVVSLHRESDVVQGGSLRLDERAAFQLIRLAC